MWAAIYVFFLFLSRLVTDAYSIIYTHNAISGSDKLAHDRGRTHDAEHLGRPLVQAQEQAAADDGDRGERHRAAGHPGWQLEAHRRVQSASGKGAHAQIVHKCPAVVEPNAPKCRPREVQRGEHILQHDFCLRNANCSGECCHHK